MGRLHLILSVILVLALLAPALASDISAAGQSEAGSPAAKVSRWESNLSVGSVLKRRLGIVKSFWWYPLPRIIALGLSFDYIGPAIPLSLNIAVNLPTPVVVPFVCAGAGGTLTNGGVTSYGGGIKLRLWHKVGIIAEYRKYSHRQDPFTARPGEEKIKSDYIGAGIAYIY